MNARQGRRIPWREGADLIALVERAGDYCGPVTGFTGDKPAVFFLLPIAHDEGVDPGARSLHHVTSPPHTFRECPDGSLEIRASIASYSGGGGGAFLWHGYLDEGNVWREV